MVFSCLSKRDLLRCHRVSKDWRTAALSDPNLYQSLELISIKKPLTIQIVEAMVRNAGGKIRSIKVYDFDTTFFEFSSNLFRDSVHVEGYQSQTRRVSGKLFRFLERYESDKSPRVTPFTESLLSQSRNLKYIKI